ncbi:integral peroxisomal membrane peroxin-domain-containing protein [Chytriomyces sp. MP71]|nr:integral peroxisomal membrane peroxin-domain-containing protein [Chytriomyces sp. MP71]
MGVSTPPRVLPSEAATEAGYDETRHAFAEHTYSAPASCDVCAGFLWGIVRQGYRCRQCGFNAHRSCLAPASALTCLSVRPAPRSRTASDATVVAGSASVSASSLAPPIAALVPETQNKAFAKPMVPSLAEEIAAQTVIASLSIEKARKEANPPLDLMYTTPKNTVGFITRLTPVVDAIEAVNALLSWTDNAKSTLALLVCLAFCCYPMLLAVLPLALVMFLIAFNYLERAKYEHSMRNNACTPQASSPPTLQLSLSQTPTYIRNVQFLQNQMGMFVKVFDAIEHGLRFASLFCDENPLRTIQILLISTLASLSFIYWIPFQWMAIGAVILAFSANTPLVRATFATLAPALVLMLTNKMHVLREGIQAAAIAPGGTVVQITIWENQRWWAGLGWIPHLLASERAPWSDASGVRSHAHKDLFVLPASDPVAGAWDWMDPEWTLDFEWTEEVDAKEGWQYCDHTWTSGRAVAGLGSMTRRRAWRRKMRFVPSLGMVAVAGLVPSLGGFVAPNGKKMD